MSGPTLNHRRLSQESWSRIFRQDVKRRFNSLPVPREMNVWEKLAMYFINGPIRHRRQLSLHVWLPILRQKCRRDFNHDRLTYHGIWLFTSQNIGTNLVPLRTPLDRPLHPEVGPSSEVSNRGSPGATLPEVTRMYHTGPDTCDLHETEYADEEEHRRDHHPRRLRGTVRPEQRRRWIPGLRSITVYFREACPGWKAVVAGTLAIASCVSCMDAGGGGGNSLRHLRILGPGGPVPFQHGRS